MNDNIPREASTTTASKTTDFNSDRRDFLRKAGSAAMAAPAVTLLLTASLKPSEAHAKMYTYYPGDWIP